MSAHDFFNIVQEPSTGMYKEKGSSFLSFIYPVLQESAIKPILLNLKQEHPKARHICHAYHWGSDHDYYRINDDGEPSGTAGNPILNQLKSFKLENTLLAVVRYFGGTLLGVPGLIQAYKHSAVDAIQHACIIIKRRNVYFKFTVSYTIEKNILLFLKKNDGEIINKKYGEFIDLEVSFPRSCHQKIISEINQISNGMIHIPATPGLSGKPEQINCTFLYKDDF